LLGAGLILFATHQYGPGLSPDSVKYISAARSVANGSGYYWYNGRPMTVWPPLYPTILAGFERIGVGAENGARWINVLIFGIIIFLTGRLLQRHVKRVALVWIGLIATVLAVPLLDSMVMVWSEPLFILLVLLAGVLLESYLRERRSREVWLLTLVLALACLDRYSGVGIVAAVLLIILALPRDESLVKRFRRALLVGIVSITPLVIWMLRNYQADGTITGPRFTRDFAVGPNFATVAEFLSAWFLPSAIALWLRVILLLCVAVLVAAVLRIRGKSDQRVSDIRAAFPLVAGWIAAFYILFLILSTARVQVDPLSSRLLSPVYPFVLLAVLVAADRVLSAIYSDGRASALTGRVIVVLLAAWLVYPALWTVSRVRDWTEKGIGYNSQAYRVSPLLEWVRAHRPSDAVFSNDTDAVYYWTRIPAKEPPSRLDVGATGLALAAPTDDATLIWFDHYLRTDYLTPRELAMIYSLNEIARVPDGTVFHITAD
jgi:hypothetical protein